MKNKILITGCAGFIGMHLCRKFLENNFIVIGVDNLNNYYDVKIKKSRVSILKKYKNFYFKKKDLKDKNCLSNIYKTHNFKKIIHLAAQAGVRYSLDFPEEYTKNNIDVFLNILEFSKKYKIKHLLYASSSSVYGTNTKYPFSEEDDVDHPISMYAVTKRSNELMAHAYSHLYKIPTTGLRFFTVYGPYGRPDMALFKFTKNILNNNKIDVYNHGNMYRDFTYVDDTVSRVYQIFLKGPIMKNYNLKLNNRPDESSAPFNIFNIGNNKKTKLKRFLKILETKLKKKAKVNYMSIQKGDVKSTVSSNKKLSNFIKIDKITNHKIGIENFVNWYLDFYGFGKK